MTRYGTTRKEIMTRAWGLYRETKHPLSFSYYLERAWMQAKQGRTFFEAFALLPVIAAQREQIAAQILDLEMTDRLGAAGIDRLGKLYSKQAELSQAAA